MAVFVPLDDGAQVQIVHVLGGQVVSNRLWFTYDRGGRGHPSFGLPELQGLSDGVAAWWTAEALPHLSADLFTAVVVADDWRGAGTPIQTVTSIGVAGGVLAESVSANVALVVPFRWPLGVRIRRNKNFVPGVPEQEITLNTPSTTIRNAIWNAYTDLVDAARLFFPVLHWRWRATSMWSGGALRPTQLALDVQGTRNDRAFVLGQRRKRLPP